MVIGESLIKLRQVSIGYRKPLMRPIDLELRRGEFWGVVGPNGAGKTTLAKTLLGLLKPLGGKVEVCAKALRASYTPQRHRLNASYPLSVFDVVLMGRAAYLPLGRRLGEGDRLRARAELARLEMSALAHELFRSLSGGQQQRVLLARALAADPDLFVLDEPAEGMDLLGARDILSFLKSLPINGNKSVLMISHRLDDAISAVDHLCLINQYSGLFEAGPVGEMASSDKLSSLYGRAIDTHACAGATHVHVREG
jgi:ABC-type Mn2+/Zn2+ transport system ATPase subunit